MGELHDTIERAKTRKAPPRNAIIPEKLGERLEQKLDGIITDQDMQGVELTTIRSNISAQGLWNWIRDLIVILLLVIGIVFMGYRAQVFDRKVKQCESIMLEVPQG